MGKLYTTRRISSKMREEECYFFMLQRSTAKINQDEHLEDSTQVLPPLGHLNVHHVITSSPHISGGHS